MDVKEANIEIPAKDSHMLALLMAEEQNRFGFNLAVMLEYENLLFLDALSTNVINIKEYLQFLIWFDKITDFVEKKWY